MNNLNNDFEDIEVHDIVKAIGEIDRLSYALGHNEFLKDDIEQIYNSDEYYYFESYRKSSWFKENTFNKFPIAMQERMIKSCSIICGEFLRIMNDETPLHMIRLIKKGYKPVVQYYTTKKYIDIDEFINYYKKKRGFLNNTFQSEVAMAVVVLCFLYLYSDDLGCFNSAPEGMLEDKSTLMSVCSFITNTLASSSLSDFENLPIPNTDDNIDYYKINKTKITMSEYINRILQIEEDKLYGYNFRDDFTKVLEARKKICRNGIMGKYIGHYTGILRMLNVEPNILLEQYSITQTDIDNIIKFVAEKRGTIDNEDIARSIVSYIFFYALTNQLETSKDLYFNNAKVREMEKYRRNKEKYELAEKKLIVTNTGLEAKNNKLMVENKELTNKISELEKEIKRLKHTNEEDSYNKKELVKLREYIFNLDKKEEFTEDYSINYELLNSANYVIVGGHNNWQNKMKEILVGCKFIAVENLSFDTKILRNVDGVIIYPNFLNHAMYYKVMEFCRHNNINVDYLSSNVNINLCLKKLEELIIINNNKRGK